LDAEELLAPVEPWQWVFSAIVCWEQQVVVVPGCKHERVTARLGVFVVVDDDLLRLKPIEGHRQLTLVALNRGHGGGHVVDHGVQLNKLLLHGLGFGRWCGHG
jgi:hypothetical protein